MYRTNAKSETSDNLKISLFCVHLLKYVGKRPKIESQNVPLRNLWADITEFIQVKCSFSHLSITEQ